MRTLESLEMEEDPANEEHAHPLLYLCELIAWSIAFGIGQVLGAGESTYVIKVDNFLTHFSYSDVLVLPCMRRNLVALIFLS